ncbi:MAG: CCA tRNA nucleotidyltransferase [Coriobacteriia bacterium]|nr:CCA tRNA nucleotidyltransferase [Coriobacteriia bacterium]
MSQDPRLPDGALRRRIAPVADLASSRGEEAYLVGGTVRDALLGRPQALADIDVALGGDAPAYGRALAGRLGAAYVPLAEERGTVRIVTPDRVTYDVTAFAGTLDGDLARRDFTINAMAFGPLGAEEALIDPFGGEEDLRGGVVRAVSERAFADDPLRTLRAFRFAATLGFGIDPQTLDWVGEHAADLTRSAPERTARELFLMLAEPLSAACVTAADACGVLAAALPETLPMRGVTQNEYHHLDVWHHSLETLAMLERLLGDLPALAGEHARRVLAFLDEEPVEERPRRALLKLAALLHDLGKPPARREDAGRVTFYTHSRIGSRAAREAGGRLRLSVREIAELEAYVDRHLVPADLEASRPLSDKRLFRFFRRNGEAGVALLLLAAADGMATRGPASDPARTESMRRFAGALIGEYYERVGPRLETRPLITGGDLIDELSLPPGPLLGRLLDEVRERQLSGELATRDDALAHVRRVLERAGR